MFMKWKADKEEGKWTKLKYGFSIKLLNWLNPLLDWQRKKDQEHILSEMIEKLPLSHV